MRSIVVLVALTLSVPAPFAQQYLGEFEVGETVPFMLIAADPITGAPTDPVDLGWSLRANGIELSTGTLQISEPGVSHSSVSTSGLSSGAYSLLVSGKIGGVTAQAYKSFTLLPGGTSNPDIMTQVSSIAARDPLDATGYTPYHAQLLQEIEIASRSQSRARLWFAQNTISSITRNVPADMASHMEVQVTSSDDILFATPLSTYYRVYYYPDSISSSKPSKEIRTTTAPVDGTFYRLPALDW